MGATGSIGFNLLRGVVEAGDRMARAGAKLRELGFDPRTDISLRQSHTIDMRTGELIPRWCIDLWLEVHLRNQCYILWSLVYSQGQSVASPRIIELDISLGGADPYGTCTLEDIAEWVVADDEDLVAKLNSATELLQASVDGFDFEAYAKIVPR
jgi:hypothetical protein